MKKTLVFILCAIMIFAAACSQNDDRNDTSASDNTETSNDASEGTVSENPTAKNIRYIDYTEESFGFFDNDELNGIQLIKTHDELMELYKTAGVGITDQFEEDFFKDNAVIFMFFVRGSGSIQLMLKNISIDEDGVLTATITERTPEVGTDDMQYKIISATVKQSDVEDVTEAKILLERQYQNSYWNDEEIEEGDVLPHRTFGGRISDKNGEVISASGIAHFDWLYIVKDKYELTQFFTHYTYEGIGDYLGSYADTYLDDKYFAENTLAFIYYAGAYNNTITSLKRTAFDESGITLSFYIDNTQSTDYRDWENLMMVEIPKDKLDGNLSFTAKFKYVSFDYTAKLGDIDFTPYVVKGCGYDFHVNVAMNETDYIPISCFTAKNRFDEYLNECINTCNDYSDDEIIRLINSFDDEFFEKKAVLISPIFVDKGEEVIIKNVVRKNTRGFGVLALELEIIDSVKPSSNENMDALLAIAVIDKTETIGYDWLDCEYNLK